MENIEKILEKAGVTVTPEQLKSINDSVDANYKPVADYNKQKLKLENLEATNKTLTATVEKFKDVDVDDLKGQIETLNNDLKTKQSEYESKLADMAFESDLKDAIAEAKGKDADIIRKNLDIEALKTSKNQKADIKKALEDLAGNELTKAFFAAEESTGKGTFPGRVTKTTTNESDYMEEMYKDHPYYTTG